MENKTINTLLIDTCKKGTTCKSCGRYICKGDKITRIKTPFQPKGILMHIDDIKNGVGIPNESINNADESSNNCRNHIVYITCSAIDFIYFSKYGFKKQLKLANGNIVCKRFQRNAQSVGVTVANAIKCGYRVNVKFLDENFKTSHIMDTVEKYDVSTKKVAFNRIK